MSGTSDPLPQTLHILSDPEALRLHIERALAACPARTRPLQAEFRRAAVLLPVVSAREGAGLLLTKRTDLVEQHKGQISFPGGGLEDGESPLDAALRETHEEIGVRPADVTILGRLDDEVMSASRFLVTPFVGLVPYPNRLRLSPQEVQAILQVPLRVLLDPENLRTADWSHAGGPAIVYFFAAGDEVIWGFTARIIARFLETVFGVPLRVAGGT